MATFDHPSDLVHRIAYPTVQRPGLRINSRVAAWPADEKKKPPVRSNLQGKQVGDIFYLIDSRPRNPWAVIGSLAFLSVLLLALIVIPLFRTDPLPKRETLTMLYLQPPSAAGGSATKLQAPKPASTYTPTSAGITAPVNKTQEAPPSTVGTTGGMLGGVPGGMVGGVAGGVFSEMLNSAPSVPVLAKSPVPAPVKRMRIASRVAEANLIHDVPPQYPPEAGRGRIEGTVVLMAVIDKDGSVKDVRVESGLPILVRAAIDAVKQWRYKPYTINGEPVEVDSRITINFTLSS
ncbi:MAG: energy transducer TonB [Candidatus Sulfotelmatobacter sp.]